MAVQVKLDQIETKKTAATNEMEELKVNVLLIHHFQKQLERQKEELERIIKKEREVEKTFKKDLSAHEEVYNILSVIFKQTPIVSLFIELMYDRNLALPLKIMIPIPSQR
jgi:SMC interacting uncharacterized protein involved in chromosome segregation